MTILVLGATGKTRCRVATRLHRQGTPLRLAGRSASTASMAPGAEHVRFDWDDPTTWDAALEGAHAVYLVAHPDRLDPADKVKDLLSRTGAHIVLLAARAYVTDTENTVRDHTRRWTVLRPTWFNQNFSEAIFADALTAGYLALPAGEGREPFIDADDIADVAVAALTDPDRHDGQTYDLSGPEAITFRQAVSLISQAADRPIAYQPITGHEFKAQLTSGGFDDDYATVLTELLETIGRDEDAHLSDGVQRALGRPPRPFTDYVSATWP